jgi:hypothetical protein
MPWLAIVARSAHPIDNLHVIFMLRLVGIVIGASNPTLTIVACALQRGDPWPGCRVRCAAGPRGRQRRRGQRVGGIGDFTDLRQLWLLRLIPDGN